ncbi:MAG: type IV toxin-antitoxin system AbiEi family antitoxin [Acidobacteriota bacterium]
MARKGLLVRQRHGSYVVADGAVARSLPSLARHLRPDDFISFRAACAHHGFCDPDPSRTEIGTPTRRPAISVGDGSIVFVRVDAASEDTMEADINGETVRIARPERALVDALRHPRHAGGAQVLPGILHRASTRVSWDRVVDLVARGGESATVQRLGHLLESHAILVPGPVVDRLRSLVNLRVKAHLGPRGTFGRHGRLDPRWNVIVNLVPRVREVPEARPIDVVLL